MSFFPAVVIEGARQVGKSTLCQQLMAEDDQAVMVTLDDASARQVAEDNPSGFVNQSSSLLVIDEIQRVRGLSLAIKASIDTDRRPGRFLLTGSVDVLQVPDNPESLAGRAATLRLRGLSQGEIAGRREDFIASVLELDDPFPVRSSLGRADYAELIARGGFPDQQHAPTPMGRVWVRDYLQRILEKDAQVFPRGTQPARLRSILNPLAANQAGEMVASRFANDLDIPLMSFRDSLNALENLFLIDRIAGWSPSATSREISRPKVVISDSALACHLMGQTAQSISDIQSPAFGPLLEGFVAGELLKQQAWTTTPFDLFHYRRANQAEVDFVAVLESGGIVGIEVKATGDIRADHLKGLRALKKSAGAAWRGGVVLYTGQKGMGFGDDIVALPVSALWQLTGAES